MRSRPSSRLVSIVNLLDAITSAQETSACTSTRVQASAGSFFENVLCADKVDASGHTLAVIRIGLGYGHGPDEPDPLAFGSSLPSQSTLRITVAPQPRVTTHPHSQARSTHSPVLKAHVCLYMTYVPRLPRDLVHPAGKFQGPLRMAMPTRSRGRITRFHAPVCVYCRHTFRPPAAPSARVWPPPCVVPMGRAPSFCVPTLRSVADPSTPYPSCT